ncbi:MAG: sigma 54-interacting transcriptional regulator [Firmicutes bacterium]|nr:sigma 54-interacting transcriptional regulator [Bacillota bacterium]
MKDHMHISKQLKKRIHYYFLVDSDNHLLPCDEDAQLFLNHIDANTLINHILNLQFHTAIITSTVVLADSSYSLKIIPVSTPPRQKIGISSHGSTPPNITHIILLQNQFYFADLLHQLGKYPVDSGEFENVLKDYDDPLYINKANGDPLYFNYRYLEVSGFSPNDFFDAGLASDMDYFEPVVTPTVMKNNMDLTTFQHLTSGRDIITTGVPLYLSNGDYNLVLFLVSPLNHTSIQSSHILTMKQDVSTKMKDGTWESPTYLEIIAESPMMKKCMQDAIKLSSYNVPCLLLGSSGCGKEVFASLIHATSRRNTGPFVKINCSALPPNLLESELFGYDAGSFTGALNRGKKGFFETSNGGTLLLDEIGDMPLESQAKLLRVLETGEFYKVGGNTPIRVDVRIIAATNKNLREMIQQGTFRSDLYYRLNVASLHLPDLKDRQEDIPLLVSHFTHYFNTKYQNSKIVSEELLEAFKSYAWPGNIRELKNIIERLVLLSTSTKLTMLDIADTDMFSSESAVSDITINGIPRLEDAVDTVEKTLVQRALLLGGNTRVAAQLLDVSQSTIMRKITKYHLTAKE